MDAREAFGARHAMFVDVREVKGEKGDTDLESGSEKKII